MAFNWLEGILKSLMMCFGVETLKDNSSPMGSPMKSLSCPFTIFTLEDNSSSGCHKSSQDASNSPFRNTTQTLECMDKLASALNALNEYSRLKQI